MVSYSEYMANNAAYDANARREIEEMREERRLEDARLRRNADAMAERARRALSGKEGLLPDKVSDLLDLALKDGARMGRKRYLADSDFLHKPEKIDKRRSIVRVGVAGMAIARTLGMPWSVDVDIDRAPDPIKNKLVALDCAGEGDARGAVLALRGKTSIKWFHGPDMRLLERFYAECDARQLALLDKWAKVEDYALSFCDWSDFDESRSTLEEFAADLRGAGW